MEALQCPGPGRCEVAADLWCPPVRTAPGESWFQIHSQICQVLILNVFIQPYWHVYFAQCWCGGLSYTQESMPSRGWALVIMEYSVCCCWQRTNQVTEIITSSLSQLLQSLLIILTLMFLRIYRILAKFPQEGRLCTLGTGDGMDLGSAQQISPFAWLHFDLLPTFTWSPRVSGTFPFVFWADHLVPKDSYHKSRGNMIEKHL